MAWKSSRWVRSVADSLMARQITPWLAGQPVTPSVYVSSWRSSMPEAVVGAVVRPTGRARRSPRCGRGCPGPSGVPTIALPGRRPSIVVDTELSPPPAVIVTSPKRSPYFAPSAERSSTSIAMNAGTRTTRGVMRPSLAGEERQRARGLLVARAARLVLGRGLGRRGLGLGPGDSSVSVSAGLGLGRGGRPSLPSSRAWSTRLLVVPAAAGNREHKRKQQPDGQFSREFPPRNAD